VEDIAERIVDQALALIVLGCGRRQRDGDGLEFGRLFEHDIAMPLDQLDCTFQRLKLLKRLLLGHRNSNDRN